MRRNQKEVEKPTFLRYLLQPTQIVSLFRASIYFMFGIFLFFIPNLLTDLPLYKYLFCAATVSYGSFRVYRIYADYQREYR
jgi:hypothetical protein